MASVTKQWTIQRNSDVTTKSKSYTGSSYTLLEETVNDGQTDDQLTISIDVSAVKAFFIVSTQAVTVETNSGSSPDDTLSLVANRPYEWDTDSYDTFKLGTDVTDLYITNASGSDADITVYVVQDATP